MFSDMEQRRAHLSAGGSIHAHVQHRTAHGRSARAAQQRRRSRTPRTASPTWCEGSVPARRFGVYERPGGQGRQAQERVEQARRAAEPGGDRRHPRPARGTVLR